MLRNILKQLLKEDEKQEFIIKENVIKEAETDDNEAVDERIIPLTYHNLKKLKDNSLLDVKKLYILTDYVATTTQKYTKSAMHKLKLLLTPISENQFSTDVKVILHEDDNYFNNCNVSSWVVKYDFENNKDKYFWADTKNGKGVIFYMQDEFNNICYYDFKNIMFQRWGVFGKSDEKYYYCNVDFETEVSHTEEIDFEKTEFYYTFSTLRYGCQVIEPEFPIKKNYTHLWVCDITVEPFKLPLSFIKGNDLKNDLCHNNLIKPLYNNNGALMLNNNLFIGSPSYWEKDDNDKVLYSANRITNNVILDDSYGNTICGNSESTIIGTNCEYNIFTDDSFGNKLNTGCKANTFTGVSHQNIMGIHCNDNILISSSNNVFENNNLANVLDNSNGNVFMFACVENHITYCVGNRFEIGCKRNKLTESSNNSFGQYCSNNISYKNFDSNRLGNDCCGNVFDENCKDNILENKCSMNKFGVDASFNHLQGNNYYILIDNGVSNTKFGVNVCGESEDALLDKNLEPGVTYEQRVTINDKYDIKVSAD